MHPLSGFHPPHRVRGQNTTITREQDERNILNLEADTCVLGKSMHHNMQLTRMAEQSYEVDPDNPYLSVYDGALYSKDYKKLVAFPAGKTQVEFHKNLKVIGQDSFINAQIPLVVVPWGRHHRGGQRLFPYGQLWRRRDSAGHPGAGRNP